jgi:hypothetical protein
MSDRDLVGTISRNKKREHDKQPEFRGSCVIDGVGYWIRGWVKEGQDGRFFSLAFSPKEQRSSARASAARGRAIAVACPTTRSHSRPSGAEI